MRITKILLQRWLKKMLRKPDWAKTAVVIVYRNQSPVEKVLLVSQQKNNRGFDKFDAEIGSKIALKLLQGVPLLEKDEKTLINIAPKYWNQFCKYFGWERMKRKFLELNGQLKLKLQ